jgi:hypothetical protein
VYKPCPTAARYAFRRAIECGPNCSAETRESDTGVRRAIAGAASNWNRCLQLAHSDRPRHSRNVRFTWHRGQARSWMDIMVISFVCSRQLFDERNDRRVDAVLPA